MQLTSSGSDNNGYVLRTVADGIFAKQYGEAPLQVLALPGWMRTVADFDRALAGRNALAVDLPGFGGVHPAPADAWSTADYAEWLLPVLEAFDEGVTLIGHSFGGRVALQLAQRAAPVRALVLTGVPQLMHRPKTRPNLSHRVVRRLHNYRLLSDGALDRWKESHGSEDYRRATGVMRDVLVKAVNENYERQLRDLRVPVHFVWGSADTAAPLADARRAAELVPAGLASLTVLEDIGHMTPLLAPESLRSALPA